MIETERLILRNWRPSDREAYADMLTDPAVGDWLGGPFSREDAYLRVERNMESLSTEGLGRMAIERRVDGVLIGHCGLARVEGRPPIPDGLEVGWALAPHAWGQGYAVEAARAAINDGFRSHAASEILAFTGTENHRSQAVMRRLGMTRDPGRDFDHPGLPSNHPLKRHIVFFTQP